MSAACCEARPRRRWLNAAGSVVPGAVAVLLPKCPLCVAAWIAAGTGVAVPAVVAGSLRPALAIACVLSVSVLIRRTVWR
ncbi:MAG TPA: hypothetical protein VML19_06670 [Verrucomicrobiae bacterium]|nr:hypothetical protein [Verrucomicrobiae bacterium]